MREHAQIGAVLKLRLRNNSIRLRLEASEVRALAETGVVESVTAFPGGRELACVVESSPASVVPAAHLSEARITVRLPETGVLAWANSDQVGLEGEQRLDGGGVLSLLVEKDFRCLAPRPGEDESDLFPNPRASGTT